MDGYHLPRSQLDADAVRVKADYPLVIIEGLYVLLRTWRVPSAQFSLGLTSLGLVGKASWFL